jgi:hypothetical protein
MIFHPIRLALVALVCMVCGIGGASAHTNKPAAPVKAAGGDSPLVACLEQAAGRPDAVEACAVRNGRRDVR